MRKDAFVDFGEEIGSFGDVASRSVEIPVLVVHHVDHFLDGGLKGHDVLLCLKVGNGVHIDDFEYVLGDRDKGELEMDASLLLRVGLFLFEDVSKEETFVVKVDDKTLLDGVTKGGDNSLFEFVRDPVGHLDVRNVDIDDDRSIVLVMFL